MHIFLYFFHVFAACGVVYVLCLCVCASVDCFLTTMADIIWGANSHRALEQGSGNRQQDSSLMMMTADSTSWRTSEEETVGQKRCRSKYNSL